MKIPMPKRQVRHPAKGRAVRMPAFPQAAQWEGREIAKLGRTLSRLGGNLGTLALRAQKLSIDNDVADSDLEFIEHMNEEEVRIQQNPDEMSWGDEYRKSAQNWVTNKKYKTEAARERHTRSLEKRISNETTRLTIAGIVQANRNFVSSLPAKMVGFIDDAQPEKFEAYLQEGFEAGALTKERVEYWKTRAEVYGVRKIAIGEILAAGADEEAVKAAKAYIRAQKLVPPTEKSALYSEIEIVAKRVRTDATTASEAVQRATVDDFFKRLTGDNPLTYREADESNSFANLTEKETWTKIAEGMGDPEPKTNWKKHNDLVMKLFDYWLGKDKSDPVEGTTYLKTKIASARYAEKYIDDNALAGINAMLSQNIDISHLGGLKRGFEEIEEVGRQSWRLPFSPLGRGRTWPEAFRVSQEEAEKIAQARNSLVSWLINDRIGRKKETSEEDISIRARQLITATKENLSELSEAELLERIKGK